MVSIHRIRQNLRTFQCQVQHGYKCRKKLHREFYSLVFYEVYCLVDSEFRPIPSFLEYPRGESQISTWIFFIFHVGVIHFLRSFI